MSYDTLKSLSVNLKELKVKYSYSPSNVYDHRDRKVTYHAEKEFETKEKLENWLMGLVSGHYDGCSPVSRSVTLFKRIMWLQENDLGYKVRVLKWRIQLRSFGKASKLYKSELEAIQENHADFLEFHNIYASEVA